MHVFRTFLTSLYTNIRAIVAPPLLRHVFLHFFNFFPSALSRIRHALMGLSQPDTPTTGSTATAIPPDSDARKRRMLHLKTKEECRLGNETIQVWTVELPSKHAEGILKYVHSHLIIIIIIILRTD